MLSILSLTRREIVAIGGITLLAAALRFYRLDALSLWLDEAASLIHGSRPFFSIWGVDTHPPLYYMLLHLWMAFGDSAFVLRSFSALVAAATVPLIFAVGRVIGGARLGLIAALLLAIAPYHLRYAQEARMYALMTFGAALALWGLAWLLQNRAPAMVDLRSLVPGKRYRDLPRPPVDAILAWAAYLLGTLIVLYSHNTGLFFLAAANLTVLLCVIHGGRAARPFLSNWIRAQIVGLAPWALFWPWIARQTYEVLKGFWIPQPDLTIVADTLDLLYFTTDYGFLEPLPTLLLLGLAGFGLWSWRRTPQWIVLILAMLLVAPLCEIVLSAIKPIFLHRTLTWTLLPFVLAVAAGIAALPWRGLAALALAGCAAVYLGGVVVYFRDFQKEDWDGAVQIIAAQSETGDLVYQHPPWNRWPSGYYLERHGVSLDQVHSPYVYVTEADPPWLMEQIQIRPRIWYFESRNADLPDPDGLVLASLKQHGRVLQSWDLYEVRLFLFEIPPGA